MPSHGLAARVDERFALLVLLVSARRRYVRVARHILEGHPAVVHPARHRAQLLDHRHPALALALGRIRPADRLHKVLHDLVEIGRVPVGRRLRGRASRRSELWDHEPRVGAPRRETDIRGVHQAGQRHLIGFKRAAVVVVADVGVGRRLPGQEGHDVDLDRGRRARLADGTRPVQVDLEAVAGVGDNKKEEEEGGDDPHGGLSKIKALDVSEKEEAAADHAGQLWPAPQHPPSSGTYYRSPAVRSSCIAARFL